MPYPTAHHGALLAERAEPSHLDGAVLTGLAAAVSARRHCFVEPVHRASTHDRRCRRLLEFRVMPTHHRPTAFCHTGPRTVPGAITDLRLGAMMTRHRGAVQLCERNCHTVDLRPSTPFARPRRF